MITSVDLFDVYAGTGVAEGFKSLAVEITIQPTTTTLTDQQIEEISAKVVKAAKKIGGELRG